MDSQKIKQDDKIHIGANIREVRLSRKMGQTELAGRVQLLGVDMTRETLVKIERGSGEPAEGDTGRAANHIR